MPRRHSPLPRFWLMTDERIGSGAAVVDVVKHLPKGRAGVIFRHYDTAAPQRRALYEAVRAVARKRRLVLLLAGGSAAQARRWQADGWHGPARAVRRGLLHSMAVHRRRDLKAAANADFIMLSPVFPTRSHPGARSLGVIGFGMIARHAAQPVIALGGMDCCQWHRLKAMGAYGYAAIDSWLPAAT